MIHTINKFIKFSFSTPGLLFTWGQTTYGWGRPIDDNLRMPAYIQNFNDVTQVATGPYHILFSTQNGNVYSAGLGDHGRLGINSTITKDIPQLIEQLKFLDIKQLIAGYRHSLALTKTGQLYSWGYAGGFNFMSKIFNFLNKHSPLGHGEGQNALVPQLIKKFNFPIIHAAAGKDFSLAVADSGQVYGWGKGIKYLNHKPYSFPYYLSEINFFLQKNKASIVKMKAINYCAFFLLDNGRLYVIGKNNAGIFATRQNPLIVTDSFHQNLTKVIDEDYKGQKITNFQISANSLIFITDVGSVFYSGMYVKYRPERFPVNIEAKNIFATYDSVGIIGADDKIYYLNDQFIDDSDVEKNYMVSDDISLKQGVIQIGGNYKLRYALVKN